MQSFVFVLALFCLFFHSNRHIHKNMAKKYFLKEVIYV